MLQLRKDGSWENCELALQQISESDTSKDLAVPNSVTGAFLGGEASQVQVVCTWAARNAAGNLKVWAHNQNQEAVFVGSLPGLIAGLLNRRVYSAVDESELGNGINEKARARLDELQLAPLRRSRGMRVEIACADHLGRRRPAMLYSVGDDTSKLLDLKAFERSVDLMLKLTVPQTYEPWLGREDRRTVTDLLYEAFKNTQEHATLGLDGNELPISFRGIAIRHHSFQKTNLAAAAAGSRPLSEFYAGLEPPMPRNNQIQLLELSVFDSGVGYASHLRRRPLDEIDPTDEYEAVVECFEKNISSKYRSGAGQGLALITSLLRRHNGLLRVRTGGLSLCSSGEEELRLVDTVSGEEAETRPPVCGTVLTCILPMRQP